MAKDNKEKKPKGRGKKGITTEKSGGKVSGRPRGCGREPDSESCTAYQRTAMKMDGCPCGASGSDKRSRWIL